MPNGAEPCLTPAASVPLGQWRYRKEPGFLPRVLYRKHDFDAAEDAARRALDAAAEVEEAAKILEEAELAVEEASKKLKSLV